MSTRHHVRRLCDHLQAAPLAPLLAAGAACPPSPALTALSASLEGLRIGRGAAAMHARASWDTPTTPLGDLPDHEALLLTGLSLWAAGRAAAGHAPADPDAAQGALTALQAAEPDFFDELLLELSRRFHALPATAGLLRAHAAALQEAADTLRAQDAALLPPVEGGLLAQIRQRLRGPGVGAPWRHLRRLSGLQLLTAKDPRAG